MNFSAIIAAGLIGLATVASQSEAFQARFKPVAPQQTQPVQVSNEVQGNQVGSLEVNRIAFTDGRATGFNELKGRASTEYRRGEPMDIYFEPTNLVTRFDGSHIRASMIIDLEVRNENGDVVASQPGAWKIPLAVASSSHQPLANVYAAISTTPISLQAGKYQVKLRINDDFGGTFLDRHVTITVQDA